MAQQREGDEHDQPGQQPRVRIVVGDEQMATRVGIRHAVEPHGIVVVGEAVNAAQAVAICREQCPDVCVLSTRIPGNGIEAARLITGAVPGTKIVMLAASGRSEELFGALRAGADGYLLTTMSPSRLPHVIRGVMNGQAALPREMTADLIREFREHGHTRRVAVSPERDVELTTREYQVLERLRRRERTSEVAARLGITEVTVRRHVSSIVHKLGARDRGGVIDMLERAEHADRS
jgi:DNA-binding NarL/FixJ family response regulator